MLFIEKLKRGGVFMGEVQMSIKYERDKQEIKNIILYSFGKIISVFGTAIYSFALSLYVLKITGSAFSFAITLVLGVIPAIIMNPFAGVIADKVNKKTLVVVMDFLSGILLVIVYFVCMNYELNLIIIYSTTFLLTVFSNFFGIGLEAAKPNVVSESMLMNINSISRILDSVSLILGPMLGGIVFVIFDIETFIIVNGVSFILSGLLMMCIHFKLFQDQSNEGSSNGKIHWIRDIKDGFYYLIERKRIKNMFIIFIFINFFLGFAVTVPLSYIINIVLKLRSEEFGIIQAPFQLE